MKILNFKDFMKKYNLRNDTMNESDLQRVYICDIKPRDSKISSVKGFVILTIVVKVVLIGLVS